MTDRTKEEIVKDIQSLLEKKVNPSVELHGGIVKFVDFDLDSGALKLQMSGACSGCAGSTQTLKYGIENMMQHYVPEINVVIGEDDPDFNEPYLKFNAQPINSKNEKI